MVYLCLQFHLSLLEELRVLKTQRILLLLPDKKVRWTNGSVHTKKGIYALVYKNCFGALRALSSWEK